MIYQYKCPFCGEEFDVTVPVDQYDPHEKCPKCGKLTSRTFTIPFVVGETVVKEQ